MKFSAVRKAVIALVGAIVAFGLIDEETAQAVISVATAVLVYVVPND